MTSSDLIAISAHAQVLQDDKYVLIWGNSEVMENFYDTDLESARGMQKEYESRTGLQTKLYQKVKE